MIICLIHAVPSAWKNPRVVMSFDGIAFATGLKQLELKKND